ncbi:MAG TPA: NfeD family protein [Thermoanaerobaculia bacterium]|nr:NfeD family protein [Thermoanaerobaculia bacterium]
MTWWIWVLFGFLLLAVEMMSTTMHVGFFGAGALFVGLLVGLGWNGPLWAQLLVFSGSALFGLFVLRPPLMRRLKLNEARVVDTLIGELATPIEDIAAQGVGKAEMRGSTWSAQNVGLTPLSKGQRCTVESIDGLVIRIRAV